MQIRVILDRSEREHQREMNAEIAKRDIITGMWSKGISLSSFFLTLFEHLKPYKCRLI